MPFLCCKNRLKVGDFMILFLIWAAMHWLDSGRESPCTPQLLTYLDWEHRSIHAKGHNQIIKNMSERLAVYVFMIFTARYSFDLVARERLARLKSTLNLKLVRRYRDKKGQKRIQGGPHLTQSGIYPINLGLKAWKRLFLELNSPCFPQI